MGTPVTNWAAQTPSMWSFGERGGSNLGMGYDPIGSSGVGYEPYSGFTTRQIQGQVNSYLQSAFPELFAFDSARQPWIRGNEAWRRSRKTRRSVVC